MLYLLHGTDTFSVREALEALKKELDADGSLATNTVVFAAAETTPDEVIAACDTVPFLGARRLVVLEGALAAARKGRGRRKRSDGDGAEAEGDDAGRWTALAGYVDRLPETTVLVLVDEEAKNAALLKALKPKGEVRRLDKPQQKAVPDWIRKRAKVMGVELAGGAAQTLAELAGNDTWALAGELAKLRDYAGGRPVTADAVRTLVSPSREIPPWELLDPIVDGKGARALKALRSVLSQKDALAVSGMIQRAYRQIAAARQMLDEGASTRDVGERLGLSNFPLDKLIDQASRHTPAMVLDAYERMLQADLDIKTGVYEPELALELLVTDLAVAAAARSRAA